MPIYELDDAIVLPAPENAEPDGLLAVGGDLRVERLVLAYANGIFPWPHRGMPMLWFSPDPRMVLKPAEIRVSRRLARRLRQGRHEFRLDGDFEAVIRACAAIKRQHEDGTWITEEMIQAYTALHEAGFAHCVETWSEGRLVGGGYGVSIGGVFTGESMFAAESDASKMALVTLARQLERWGFDLLDAQVHTEHLERMGAGPMPRDRFLEILRDPGFEATRRGPWQLDEDLRLKPDATHSDEALSPSSAP
jgi:leucyl/phenylalanyl-tRNA--protein transferase